MRRAYSPYSRVRVGAALRAADGRIYGGCNVENASFGLTLCAERCAVARAVSDGARRFTAIAIVADTPSALTPCGACRQTLHEFAPDLRVLLGGPRAGSRATTLAELLPDAFGPRELA